MFTDGFDLSAANKNLLVAQKPPGLHIQESSSADD
jgi:hypothetical protein